MATRNLHFYISLLKRLLKGTSNTGEMKLNEVTIKERNWYGSYYLVENKKSVGTNTLQI
jgi:hypothetical protein